MVSVGQHDKARPLPIRATAAIRPRSRALKRAFDIVVASMTLVLLFPLLAIVVLLVFATMGTPVIRRHSGVGFGGSAIDCYKFRTTQSLDADANPTALGQVLTQSGIDELPQLINVLRGEMSCVGSWPQWRSVAAVIRVKESG